MALRTEDDFPPGHPKRFDYDPQSDDAQEWARLNLHPKGERDFPVDHPKAVDTPGNTNHLPCVAGVDPLKPQLEQFTGRTPEHAAAIAEFNREATAKAMESPVPDPMEAPKPPPPGDISQPTGQPNA